MRKRRLSESTARQLTVYGIGRAAFGAGAMAAPGLTAEILVGPTGREFAPRTLMGNFGTRDVILGAGMLHAVRSGGPTRPWLAAGFAADVLDTVVQLREWKELPPGRRAAGVGSAAGAAVLGAVLLAVNR
jgi:peptide-methionine (R)-S-oxide reductase